MKTVKHVCRNCDHVTYTNLGGWLRAIFILILIVLGFMFLIWVIIIGPTLSIDLFTSAILTKYAQVDMLEARQIALNYSTFDGHNSYLMATDLVRNMPRIRYVSEGVTGLGQDYRDTLNYGGDCKQDSIFFVAMMTSLGYTSYVDCSIDNNHCVAKVLHEKDYKSGNSYMVVDLTNDQIRIYPDYFNHWKHPDNYTHIKTYRK